MGNVIPFDAAKRRRPSSCISPALRRRIALTHDLAELEQAQDSLREQLRGAVKGTARHTELRWDLEAVRGEIELIEEKLGPATVTKIGATR